MDKIILVSSTQYPGYGGAATNAYAIIKLLKENGYRVFGIFFVDTNVNVDPDNIGNIFRFSCLPFDLSNDKIINNYRNILRKTMKGSPSIMLCKNYLAPTYCKILYPNTINIYLVSGIPHFSLFFPNLSAQYLLSNNVAIPAFVPEIKSIENSKFVVANSNISLKLLQKIYPKYMHKIYPDAIDTTKEIKSIINSNIPCTKKYDFIIVASNLTRTDKNNLFLIDILKEKCFNNFTKIIIGNDNSKFKSIPNSTLFGLMPHREVLKYMAQTKILLYPSLTDANPNTVREAIYHKCIALISNNVGFYESFPIFSVCNSYQKDEWINKSLYVIKNYDNLIKNYRVNFEGNKDIMSFIKNFI